MKQQLLQKQLAQQQLVLYERVENSTLNNATTKSATSNNAKNVFYQIYIKMVPTNKAVSNNKKLKDTNTFAH